MKAAAFFEPGPPRVLQYIDVAPPACGPGQVLVRTAAIGLNFADIYRRKGEYGVVPPSPYILGYEAAGVVEAVGSHVSKFRPGDRVAFANVPRANAELVVCPEDRLVGLPGDLSFDEAAGIMLQGMTANYLTHDSHSVRSGETVLVHSGGSGVGSLVLQYCRQKGARTLSVVSSDEKALVALEAGADQVVVDRGGDWEAQVRRLGDIDVVFDAVGSSLTKSLALVRTRGHVVFYGWAGGVAPLVDPRDLMNRSLRLSGGDLWSFVDDPGELQKRAHAVFSDLKSGKLRLRIDRKFHLSEASLAHAHLEGRGARGKILLLN